VSIFPALKHESVSGENINVSETRTRSLIDLTTDIVSAFVSNNSVPTTDLPDLIMGAHSALLIIASGATPAVEQEAQKPAVPIKKSVTEDFIICLEDGFKFKSLKRHLRTKYDMSPDAYREKWGLGADYPMVAPNYSAARSQLAKQTLLGQQRRRK